jgi:hypothetical protein
MPEVCLRWLKCALGSNKVVVKVCTKKHRCVLGGYEVTEVCLR